MVALNGVYTIWHNESQTWNLIHISLTNDKYLITYMKDQHKEVWTITLPIHFRFFFTRVA